MNDLLNNPNAGSEKSKSILELRRASYRCTSPRAQVCGRVKVPEGQAVEGAEESTLGATSHEKLFCVLSILQMSARMQYFLESRSIDKEEEGEQIAHEKLIP